MALDNTRQLDKIWLLGAKLKPEIRDNVTSASISMSSDQVSQFKFTIADPGFKLLAKGVLALRLPVKYDDQRFIVSGYETQDLSGIESIVVTCRSEVAQKLKDRTGTLVMSNVSPSEFVRAEAKAVGAKVVVQTSPSQTQVARDVPKQGEKYDKNNKPSTWTTILRLADELGYIAFESGGTIYFGQPTWLLSLSKKTRMRAVYGSGYDDVRIENIPSARKNLDSAEGTSISFTIPNERAREPRPGRAVYVSGVPKFSRYYLIDSVDFDLAGEDNRVTVNASVAINPEPNPPDTGASGDGLDLGRGGATSKGSNPLKHMSVTAPFGQKGSWAAGFHTGTDLNAGTGTECYAVYDGTITGDDWGSAYGNHIVLAVPGKGKYAYCHLQRKVVSKGQKVVSGQLLGYTDTTGRAFGAHLHFELRVSPYRYGTDSRNPMPTLGDTISTGSGGAGSGTAGKSLSSVLRAAGFSGNSLQIAMGIAWAESGNDATATNNSANGGQWGPAVGLMQIRSLRNPPSGSSIDAGRSASKLKNALFNAQMAWRLSNHGTKWSDWTVYTSGAYRKYIGKDGNIKHWSGSAPTTSSIEQSGGSGPSYTTSKNNSKSASVFTGIALAQAGDRYVFGAHPGGSSDNSNAFDCSGLVSWAAARVGCSLNGGTGAQWSRIYSQRADIPVSVARNIRGALLYKNPFGGNAHVAISLGDGRTIEAKNPSKGVGIGSASDNGYNLAGLVPGMRYSVSSAQAAKITAHLNQVHGSGGKAQIGT